MLVGSQPYWYEDHFMERIITHTILNSLLYLQELQMKCVGTYKDLISELYNHSSVICVPFNGYLPVNLIPLPIDWNV